MAYVNPFKQLKEVGAFFNNKINYNNISNVVTKEYSRYIEEKYPGNTGWKPREKWLHNFVTWILKTEAQDVSVEKIMFEIKREAERDVHDPNP
jgi:hypothetical protein